jgi:dihydromonapterin reductase/dihydrofolate reductase
MSTTNPPILITGGAQRVGLHICEQLLARGERIILTYRRERSVLDTLRAQGVITLQADFSTQEGVFAFVDALKTHTDSLRAILHNASTWSKDETIVQDPSHFNELMNVHVFAPYWINLQCEDLLREGEGLRDIIAISDHTVSRGSDKHAAYLASKAGLESLTLSFAKRFAPRIKVNAIAPALVMFNEGD